MSDAIINDIIQATQDHAPDHAAVDVSATREKLRQMGQSELMDLYRHHIKQTPIIEDEGDDVALLELEWTPTTFYGGALGYGNTAQMDGQLFALEVYGGQLRLLVWADFEDPSPTDIISLEGASVYTQVDKMARPSGLAVDEAPYIIDRRDPCGVCLESWEHGTMAHAAPCDDQIGSTWVHIDCYEETFA